MDAAIQVMGWVRLVLLILAAGFAVKALNVLRKSRKRKKIFRIKKHVFWSLAAATIFFALGIALIQAFELLGMSDFPSAADVPIVLAHLLFVIAFVYFWVKTTKLHRLDKKELFFFFAVLCAVVLWLVFLFKTAILPGSEGAYWLADILYWYYPIAAALMFLSTLIVNPLLKADVITTPLWYISSGVFLHFIAFNMNYYTFWNPTSLYVPSMYALLYVFSAGLFVIGFYTACKKYR